MENTLTKWEVDALKRRVFDLFEGIKQEEWPFSNKKVMEMFIEYLVRLKVKGNWAEESEKIYDFFDNYLNTVHYFRIIDDEMEREFADYPRILFWKISLRFGDRFGRACELSVLERYIVEITEHIVLREDMSLLVDDAKKFIDENTRGLKLDPHSDYDDWSKARDVVAHFDPRRYLESDDKGVSVGGFVEVEGNGTNKFYPRELYEKIKEVIPPIFKDGFRYGYYNTKGFFGEDSKKSDTEKKKNELRRKLPEGILSQKMSDDEIIEKLKEHGGELLDKAVEEKNECVYNFIMRKAGVPLWQGETDDEFIDYVLKTEIKKCGSDEKGSFGISRVIYRLEKINDETIIGNSIFEQKSRFDDKNFSNKVREVFSRREDLMERILQVSLNEEVSGGLENITKKVRLLTLIGTKKSFFKIWDILGTRKCGMDGGLYVDIVNKWAEHFPIKLLKKEIENQNNLCVMGVLYSENEYAVRALFALLYKGCNVVIGSFNVVYQRFGYTSYYKLLICLATTGSHDADIYGRDVERWDYRARLKKFLIDIIGIVNNNSVFGQRIKETFEGLNIDLTQKQVTLLDGYMDRSDYIAIKRWLHEHDGSDLDDGGFGTNEYNEIQYAVLEKAFFYPEYSRENERIIANCFNRKLPFSDFVWQSKQQSDRQVVKTSISWRRYWQNLIEEAYKKFKQPEYEKPLLPIIPEYAEYLLSRTNDMFSTAIVNISYVEYKAFLTESRKSQIKICLKNDTIRKEEAEKLTALAESLDGNYYAWSDREIKDCLSPDTDSKRLDKVNAILEPEFMVRIFEKSILWVMEHRDSELWLNAPWFGMQIFNKSYNDRPAIWAKHLLKIVDEWNGSKEMLKRVCIALGHLREPLGTKVPIKLREMATNPKNEVIKEDINIQLSLFNRENFRKMHHEGNERKRVELCKKELITGQNKEVSEKTEKE